MVAIAVSMLVASCAQSDGASPTATLSAEEIAQLEEQQQQLALSLTAAYPNAELPSVDIVRLIHPNEALVTLAECLRDSGFDATVEGEGVDASYPLVQAEAYALAHYACNMEYPVHPYHSAPPSNDELLLIYDYYVNSLVPCLSDHGYSTSEAPSSAQFVESYWTNAWLPYSEIGIVSDEEWQRLRADCPELPSTFRPDRG